MATNIGTGPQDIPLNQYLGDLAFQDTHATSFFRVLASDPATGVVGECYFNSTDGKVKVYDGSAWSALGSGSGLTVSNEYLYLPFNETSSSRTKYGNYATSLTLNAGGQAETIHPYTITDNTYNSGNARSHRCNGESDTCYFDGNSILGSIGVDNICYDFWYNWRGTGNGGGSYGYVGDYAGANLYSPTRSGLDIDNYIKCGGIASNVLAGYTYGATSVEFATSLSTDGNLNTWYHVLVLRKSNKWYAFVNGVLNAYYVESTPHNIANGGGFHFGTIDRSGHWWNVNVADFMFQRGADLFYSIDPSINASDIGTTYFVRPEYKNKKMAAPTSGIFSVLKGPSGFS